MELSMGDNNSTQTMEEAYGYSKQNVAFESMEKLADCDYLGGKR